MIIKLIEYKVKDSEIEKILPAIKKFLFSVKEGEPHISYEIHQRQNTTEFIHLIKFPDSIAIELHRQAPYTQEFVDILYPSCETTPVFTDLLNTELDQNLK